jgi:2-keto-3-deoxy-L-rhamnonate aldolase RhmA
LIDPVRSASADISVKIVVPKPARREAITLDRLWRVTYTGLRERLRRREPLAAAFLDLGSPVSAEVTAMSGFDVVVVDLEHGAGDEAAARAQIAAAQPHAAVVVRVPNGPAQAGRMLDAGADGVIVPQVGSVEEAARAGAAVRYAGAGRGISPFSRGNRYGAAGADFRPRADERVACIVQIERASALEAVDEIAALDEVDGLLMGPADLSNDLGCELDLAGERLVRAATDIAAAATRHGKTAALHMARADQAAAFRDLGFTMLSCSFESAVLAAGSSAIAAGLRL